MRDRELETEVQRLTLRRALLALSAKQRAVIVLRFFEDHTEAEARPEVYLIAERKRVTHAWHECDPCR